MGGNSELESTGLQLGANSRSLDSGAKAPALGMTPFQDEPLSVELERTSSARDLIDPQQLNQHDEDSDAEVQIVRGFAAHGGGQRQSALTEDKHQRAFALEDEICDPPVARGDRQAKKKSRKFEWHEEMVSRSISGTQ